MMSVRLAILTAGFVLAATTPCAVCDELALFFGAPAGTVTLPDRLPSAGSAFTVELRFKTVRPLKGSSRVVSQWDPRSKAPDKGAFYVELGAAGKVAFGLLSATGKTKVVEARTAWRDGGWHHVACAWDGAEATVYVDGARVAGEKLAGFGTMAASKLPLVIGTPVDPKARVQNGFEGFLSDVAVWRTAHDAATIAQAPKARLAGSEPDLAVYLALREPSPVATSGEATISQALARASWCRTPWWFSDEPNRPCLHLFSYDAGIAGATRRILVTNEARSEAGVLWQGADAKVQLTWIDIEHGEHRTLPLKAAADDHLVAGATDATGNAYYLMVEKSDFNRAAGPALRTTLYLANSEGRPIQETALNTSKDELDLWCYEADRDAGSMVIGPKQGCFLLPRRMYLSSDGLRHQSAIAVTFALDLKKVQNLGQTSGHSLGNVLTTGPRGEFLALDLGDNYPRGVHLHRIANNAKTSRVVFTFKTEHETRPRNGSPAYPEISRSDKTFYKWSNDNRIYTELGGVGDGAAACVVLFTTDRSPAGKVLDNSRIGFDDEPRDLAMVRVAKAFGRGTAIEDVLATPGSGSPLEVGGFFDFGGRWVVQRVAGVLWLTKYASGEAAHAPQMFMRRDNTITIVWEKTDDKGTSLATLTVDESGRILSEATRLDSDLRLEHDMLPRRLGGRLFTLTQNGDRNLVTFIQDE